MESIDNRSRNKLITFRDYHNSCKKIEFEIINKFIISGNDDGKIRCWNIINGDLYYISNKICDGIFILLLRSNIKN